MSNVEPRVVSHLGIPMNRKKKTENKRRVKEMKKENKTTVLHIAKGSVAS